MLRWLGWNLQFGGGNDSHLPALVEDLGILEGTVIRSRGIARSGEHGEDLFASGATEEERLS